MKNLTSNEPLSLSTIGRKALLSDAAVGRIVEAVGRPLVQNVRLAGVGSALNFLVDQVTSSQLSARFDQKHKKEINKIIKALHNYHEISLDLGRHNNLPYWLAPPPRLPDDWFENASNWVAKTRARIISQKNGGRPKKDEIQYFYHQALGIFFATFHIHPTSATGRHGTNAGPAARFIGTVFREAKKSIEDRGFGSEVNDSAKIRARWDEPSQESLEHNIGAALKKLGTSLEDCNNNEPVPQPPNFDEYIELFGTCQTTAEEDLKFAWASHALFYAQFYVSR